MSSSSHRDQREATIREAGTAQMGSTTMHAGGEAAAAPSVGGRRPGPRARAAARARLRARPQLPGAAGSLRERLEETLTLTWLGVTGNLKRTLESTNPCALTPGPPPKTHGAPDILRPSLAMARSISRVCGDLP
jgi:hypothetical protein